MLEYRLSRPFLAETPASRAAANHHHRGYARVFGTRIIPFVRRTRRKSGKAQNRVNRRSIYVRPHKASSFFSFFLYFFLFFPRYIGTSKCFAIEITRSMQASPYNLHGTMSTRRSISRIVTWSLVCLAAGTLNARTNPNLVKFAREWFN